MLIRAGENQAEEQTFDQELLKSPTRLSVVSSADEVRVISQSAEDRHLPPPGPEDIRDIENFFRAAEPGSHFAITENNGKSWRFAIVTGKFENTYREGLWRYSVDVDLERMAPDFRHCSRVIFTRDFEPIPLREWVPRMVVRPISADEVEKISFSYSSQHKFAKS